MFTNLTRWLTSRRAARGNLTPACVCAGRRSHKHACLFIQETKTSRVILSLDYFNKVRFPFPPCCVSVSTARFPTCEPSSCWPSRAETSRWSLPWWITETSPSTLSKTSSCQLTCTPETSLLRPYLGLLYEMI